MSAGQQAGGEGAAGDVRRRRVAWIPEQVRYPWEMAEGVAGDGAGGGEPVLVLAEPSAVELTTNFAGAMGRWVAAGVPVVSEAVYGQRSAACGACELWDGAARFGLGKCLAPGCGCTRFARWLATEVCKYPAGSRWPA